MTGGPYQVTAGVHAVPATFEGVPLHVYIVEGASLGVVDSGTAVTPSRHLLPALDRLGARPEHVEVTINTHAHHDHFGGNGAIRAAHPGVRIAVHHADAGWAESSARYVLGLYRSAFPGTWDPSAAFQDRLHRLCGPDTAVDQLLDDGDVVDLGAGRRLRVIWTPAHSPGHVLLHDEESGVLFAGDALQGHGVPIDGRPWLFPYYLNVAAYRRSLAIIRSAAPRYLCTAHRGVLAGPELERELADADAVADDLDDILTGLLRDRGRVTLTGAVDHVLISWPHFDRGLQVHSTLAAHFNQMVRDGTAAPRIEDGVKSWTSLLR